MSISAKSLVNVIPGVLGAGGNALNFNGVILTNNPVCPTGTPTSFPGYDAVAAFFGAESIEAQMAQVYFTGFNGSSQLPNALLFAYYDTSASVSWDLPANIGSLQANQGTALLNDFQAGLDVVVTAPEGATYLWSVVGTGILAGSVSIDGSTPNTGSSIMIDFNQLWVTPGVPFMTVACAVTVDDVVTNLTQDVYSLDSGVGIFGLSLESIGTPPQTDTFGFTAPAGTTFSWSIENGLDVTSGNVNIDTDPTQPTVLVDWSEATANPGSSFFILTCQATYGVQVWNQQLIVQGAP